MIKEIIEIEKLSKPVIKASMPILKKIKDNVKYKWDTGLLDYFINTFDKYKNIKTLLYRQPTNFYDIYHPTVLSYKNEVILTDNLAKLFKKRKFITIIGDAGSGKSMLIKHLFIQALRESYKAPIFIALRDLDIKNSDLEAYIRNHILRNKLSPSNDFLTKLLKNGDFLFFLDGYDEIKSSEKHEITKNLEVFIDKFPKNNFILTSRPYSNIEYFKNFYNYEIKDLSQDDRVCFIKQQIKDKKLAGKIIDSIKESKDNYIDSFLKNSLLLTLYIITYSKNSSIPKNKYIFYRRVFDVLFAEHDSATKIGFEREIKTKLTQESLEKVLQKFSFLSFFDNNFDFPKDYIFDVLNKIKNKNENLKFKNNDFIEDMKVSIAIWLEDCGLYMFSHRSMQEYFAAVFIKNINTSENKKNIYKKITQKTSKSSTGMTNILSLCYEMDKYAVIKYYILPVLKKIRLFFINKDNELNYNFEYINKGFKKNSVLAPASLNLIVNISQFLGKDFFHKFIYKNIVNKFLKNKEYANICNFIEIQEDGYCFLAKNRLITDEYIEFISQIGVEESMKKLIKELDVIRTKFEKKLKKKELVESDFINMI